MRDDDQPWGFGPPRNRSDGEDESAYLEHSALSWRPVPTAQGRRNWWEWLWDDVCQLRIRYRLPVRTRWWEDEIRVEALAALAAWVQRYDSGSWDDPPGKLSLLFELERVEALLRDGNGPFHPRRDRAEFERYLELMGATAC